MSSTGIDTYDGPQAMVKDLVSLDQKATLNLLGNFGVATDEEMRTNNARCVSAMLPFK
jgi:hypothetical protein